MTPRRTCPVLVCLLLLAGCARTPPSALYPVSGTVTRFDAPVSAGGLIFIPESGFWGGRVVNASVNPDGTFTVSTSTTIEGKTVINAGAPVGRYKVFYHPPSDGQKVGTEIELPDVVVVEPTENVFKLGVPEKKPPVQKDEPPADGKGVPPAEKPSDGK